MPAPWRVNTIAQARELRICAALADLRNEELHSGSIVFSTLPTANWLTQFYRAADALAKIQGHTLQEFLGEEEVAAATEMITAGTAAVKAKVQKMIHDHTAALEAMPEANRTALTAASAAQAEMLAWHQGTA